MKKNIVKKYMCSLLLVIVLLPVTILKAQTNIESDSSGTTKIINQTKLKMANNRKPKIDTVLTIADSIALAADTITNPILSKISIGIKTGFNIASMHYTKPEYETYKHALFIRPMLGLTVDYQFSDKLSIKPELLFIGKGNKIRDDIDYKIKIKTVDLNIPLIFTPDIKIKGMDLFLLAGPSINIVRKGKITLDNYSTKISDANIKATSIGVRAGGGVKHPVKLGKYNALLYAEIAYNLGLTDTWSDKELRGSAYGLNINPYNITDTRKNRGIELGASLMVPLSEIFPKREHIIVVKREEIKPQVEKIPEKDCYSIAEMKEYIKKGLDVTGRKICLHTITFETNKATLKAEAKTFIDEIVSLLKTIPTMNMQINGHTDNVGGAEYNLELSKKRATSVYEYLVSQGIDKKRLTHEGYGDTKPIDTNDTDEGKANNRRVEFEIKQ
jgi:OOP family OmpA-OmpF porin